MASEKTSAFTVTIASDDRYRDDVSRSKSIAKVKSIPGMSLQHRMSQITPMAHNSYKGTTLAVFTAGDDSQGMNAALRGVVRMGMYLGCTVILIKRGFKGMVEGGDNYVEATWKDTSDIIDKGGTKLKTFKCPEFFERAARLKAAKNLIEHGINDIVAIGGDGTLKGINCLYTEWISLLRELDDKHLVDRELLKRHRYLKAVGVVATVNNEVCGTERSIGCNSALHRIMEATDAIAITSSSSQQAFVVEIMGKDCGYLALATAVGCDASMVFIPEWPPGGDWKDELYSKVHDDIRMGSEGILIIVSEGAIDRQGRPIKAEAIKEVLTKKLNMNAKITVLGHVQRGGSPSAADRLLATRMGAEASFALRDLRADSGACVIGNSGNEIICMSLSGCLEKTAQALKCIEEKNFVDAVRIRGRLFQSLLSAYNLMHGLRGSFALDLTGVRGVKTVAIIRVGSQTIGQCIATKAIVGLCESKGFQVLGIKDGFEGLVDNDITNLSWEKVKFWSGLDDNDCLGSSNKLVSAVGLDKVATAIGTLSLDGLVILGGFSAYESLCQIHEDGMQYKELCIPMCMVPVTILNNIPGTEVSVGTDTALNELVSYCDKMKRVARGNHRSLFLVETMGSNCGYLASICALCVGADAAYIRQESFDLDDLLEDANHLRHKIQHSGIRSGLILRSEFANANYTIDFMDRLFKEEGKGVYTCRSSVIGSVQMGGIPSPSDRYMATIAGFKCGEWMIKTIGDCTEVDGTVYSTSPNVRTVLSIAKRGITFRPVCKLLAETDFDDRIPTYNWWMKLRPLMRILAKHYEQNYLMEADDFLSDTDTNASDI